MTLFDVTVWESTEEPAIEGEMVFTIESAPAKTKFEACKDAVNFYREFFEIPDGHVLSATAKVVR